MARNTNVVVLEGHLTKNVSISMAGDVKKCDFTIAVNHGKNSKGEEKTSFVAVQAWRQLATNVATMCEKGTHVIVTGELFIDSWQADGRWNNRTYIKADNVRILDPKKAATSPANEEVDYEFPWPSEDEQF